ncbi:MAG: cupin domain-containing protein [Gammaproteobacteria bacterium]
MKRLLMHFTIAVALAVGFLAASTFAAAPEQKYVIKPVAQKTLTRLPTEPLYWRVETFPTLTDARAAVGPDGWNPAAVRYETTTSLIAEIANKVWVVTLGPQGASTPGGTKVAEIGPLPSITASEYLLRLNYGYGQPGAKTPVHSHPGSESFYVISGRLGQKTPHGVSYVDAGRTMNGHAANTTMEVFNAGKTELQALIMFVVDAGKPFSVPAKFKEGIPSAKR